MTYRDVVSRRIAREVLIQMQRQYPEQLLVVAIRSFDKGLPQSVSLVSKFFLPNRVVRHGQVDLVGASRECQSVIGYKVRWIRAFGTSTTWLE